MNQRPIKKKRLMLQPNVVVGGVVQTYSSMYVLTYARKCPARLLTYVRSARASSQQTNTQPVMATKSTVLEASQLHVRDLQP